MSNVLDTILIRDMIGGTTAVNSEFTTESIDTSFKEGPFSIQLVYTGGVNVNMNLVLQLSNDNVNFADIDDSIQTITDSDGSHIWDVLVTGTNYVRVKVEVTTGSINLDECRYKAKRRH
jgi:hypothetical protein